MLRYHENCRIFQDRLVNQEDQNWFNNQFKEHISRGFEINFNKVVVREPIIYGDFMVANAENKVYDEITDNVKVVFPFLQNINLAFLY